MAINVNIDTARMLDELQKASDRIAKDAAQQMAMSIKQATVTISGLTLKPVASHLRQIDNQIKAEAVKAAAESVTRKNVETLVEQYAQASQRLKMLLTLIGAEELRRIGLLDAEASLDDDASFAAVIEELDRRVDQFNEAHARLTGKRKRIPETGALTIEPHEMQMITYLRARGCSTQEILQEIKKQRAMNP